MDSSHNSDRDLSIPLMLFFCTAGICVAMFTHFSRELTYQQQTIANQQEQITNLKYQLTQSEARYQGYVEGRR
jgi:hypothetical protein